MSLFKSDMNQKSSLKWQISFFKLPLFTKKAYLDYVFKFPHFLIKKFYFEWKLQLRIQIIMYGVRECSFILKKKKEKKVTFITKS